MSRPSADRRTAHRPFEALPSHLPLESILHPELGDDPGERSADCRVAYTWRGLMAVPGGMSS